MKETTTLPAGFTKSEDGLTVTNSYKSPTFTVEANKVWAPSGLLNSLKTEVEFQLYRKAGAGAAETVGAAQKVNATGGWKTSWANMPTHDTNGNAYTYYVKEVNVPANFTADDVDDLTVTNTYGSPTGTVEANKVWAPSGLLNSLKTEVAFQLYRKVGAGAAETVGTAQAVNTAGGWKTSWANMPTHAQARRPGTTVAERVQARSPEGSRTA